MENITNGSRTIALLIMGIALAFGMSASASSTAKATAKLEYGVVVKIDLTDAGDGYDDQPLVRITGGGGSGAKALATSSDQSGVHFPISGIYVESGGSGYNEPPQVEIESPEEAHARTHPDAATVTKAARTATATAEVANGAVVKINITDGGKGYDFAPKVTFTGGGGTGATAEVYQYLSGSVGNIVIHSGGSGYTSAPQIAIEPPDTMRAVAMEIAATKNAELAAQKAAADKVENEKVEAQQKAEEEDKARQNTESLKTVGKYVGLVGVIIAAIVAFRLFSKKSKSVGNVANKDLGISKNVVFAGVAVVVLGFAIYAYNTLHKSSDRPDRQSASSSISISMSDVAGHWANDSDMVDITLRSSGFGTLSYGHNDDSRVSWHLNGNTVVIDAGDGGAPLTFVYQSGKLIAPNGHSLTPH